MGQEAGNIHYGNDYGNRENVSLCYALDFSPHHFDFDHLVHAQQAILKCSKNRQNNAKPSLEENVRIVEGSLC